jgi:hypothetical protein
MPKPKSRQKKAPGNVTARLRHSRGWLAALVALFGIGVAAFLWMRRQPNAQEQQYKPRPRGEVTFAKHIAPIVYEQCAPCHRPGEPGPFNLLTYDDVKKRARQVAEVTQGRVMPPWLPAEGYEPLADRRRLTVEQIGLIQQWVVEGSVEGNAADLPPKPQWAEGWQLGPPDLIARMPEPYTLPADGKDVYRNFIIPTSLATNRFVRAVEFRPGSKAIHHAFIRFDRSRDTRRLDAKDPDPGFPGMDVPPSVETPAGHFSGWAPGRPPSQMPEGLAWSLPGGADVVLLMHMQPLGRPETIQPSIGFYFTDRAPTNTPALINLRTYDIDIPAGATNYTAEETTTLPVAVDLLAIKPHTHYVGKRLEGFAMLPDGTRKTLLLIPDWDFNWQSDYRFARPVSLPAGTTLGLKYGFDNSTNNTRNPHHPPARVRYGVQTTDEMAELAFQMLARNDRDREQLQSAIRGYVIKDMTAAQQRRLRENPADAEATAELGKIQQLRGDSTGAEALLRRAIALNPASDDARYHLGVVLLTRGSLAEAEREFVETLRINSAHYKARNNAGITCLRQGKLDEAEVHFREALRLNPGDTFAKNNLDLVLRTKGQSGVK